jgi:hypothetical protein
VTEAERLAVFDAEPSTIGLEEDVMLVDPVTLGLARSPTELLDGGAERAQARVAGVTR